MIGIIEPIRIVIDEFWTLDQIGNDDQDVNIGVKRQLMSQVRCRRVPCPCLVKQLIQFYQAAKVSSWLDSMIELANFTENEETYRMGHAQFSNAEFTSMGKFGYRKENDHRGAILLLNLGVIYKTIDFGIFVMTDATIIVENCLLVNNWVGTYS